MSDRQVHPVMSDAVTTRIVQGRPQISFACRRFTSLEERVAAEAEERREWEEKLAEWNAGCDPLAYDECDSCGRLILPGEAYFAWDTGYIAHAACTPPGQEPIDDAEPDVCVDERERAS
jgi:hypothetical protein